MTDEWTYTNEQMLNDYHSATVAADIFRQFDDYEATAAMLKEAILERMNNPRTDEWESEITTRVRVLTDRPR